MTWKGFRDTENVWRKSWKIFGSLFYCVSDSWHAFDASKVIFLLKKSLCKESTGVGFSIEFSSRISCSCLTLLPLRLKWRVTPFWHRTQLWWCSRELFLVFDGKRRKVLYLCVLPCILKCKLWRPSASCNSFVTVVATSILISFINEFLSLSLSLSFGIISFCCVHLLWYPVWWMTILGFSWILRRRRKELLLSEIYFNE